MSAVATSCSRTPSVSHVTGASSMGFSLLLFFFVPLAEPSCARLRLIETGPPVFASEIDRLVGCFGARTRFNPC